MRRLARLKSAFMKKFEETKQAIQAWSHRRTSKYLFDRICQCKDEAKQNFDLFITTIEELEMCTKESVWESDYAGKKAEIEGYYSRMSAAINVVAVCAEREKQKKVEEAAAAVAAKGVVGAVCAEQEKQKKVEQAAAAAAAGGGAVGGGEAVGGIKYRTEMALCPEKLAVDSTGLEYHVFLHKCNSYYLASNFGHAPPEKQIVYLTNCLSADLLAKLHFGDCATIEQALNVIDVDYKARNPDVSSMVPEDILALQMNNRGLAN